MPGSHLFNLGLFQKKFGGNNRIAGVSINLGSTKGRGSSTRMFNYCNQHSANSSECINQFINVAPTPTPTPTISVSYTGASIFYSNPYTGTSNGYTYLKFTNSGTINIISDSVTIYYVIVGGGGNGNGGPSGAGGSGIILLKYPDAFTISNPGGGLTISAETSSSGFKIVEITAGTGNISWS